MTLLSTTIKNSVSYGSKLYVFGSNGLDLLDGEDFSSIATASLANCVGGAVNDLGVYLATSDRGVWFLGHGRTGELSRALVQIYGTTTTPALASNIVQGIAAHGSALLVCTAAGASYLPEPLTVYRYTDAGGCKSAAINGTHIAYAVASGLHVRTRPTSDWTTTGTTVLTTASSPAIINNTVQGLAYGNDLFIATSGGVSVYNGSAVTSLTGTQLGTVVDCKQVYPASTASRTAGVFAYVTSNGASGGRFGIYNLATASNEVTVSGDATACWVDDNWQSALYNDTLAQYAMVDIASPVGGSVGVRRDWSLWAEVTDSLGGISPGSVTLTVDGTTVTPATTSTTNGYRVTYAPPAASGYGQSHSLTLTASDIDGNLIARTWSFAVVAAAVAASSGPPPNIVVAKDIGIPAGDEEDLIDGIGVVWLPDETSPLIVTDDQAETVGALIVNAAVYHQHVRTVKVDRLDDNSDQVASLREGDIVSITATALGETAKKCEVLAIRQDIDDQDAITYSLVLGYYELVAP